MEYVHGQSSQTIDLTWEDEQFLGLLLIAARYDCIEFIEWECIKLYGHDRLTKLDRTQQMQLHEEAREAIFTRALRCGYRPSASQV
ncbi:MAG: hypothetical protein ABJO27_13085 [Pseudoruegeria sp.]